MSSSADFSAIASDLADEPTVFLDPGIGPQKEKVLSYLIAKAIETSHTTGSNGIVTAALGRKEKAPTGLPGGTAIPHYRHEDWSKPTLMFTRPTDATEFTTPDRPAGLPFFIGVSSANSDVHVDILTVLAKALRDEGFHAALRGAENDDETAQIISEHITEAPRQKARNPPTKTNIVTITACPTGIAHAYLAAGTFTGTAENMADVTLTIEIQGLVGTQDAPTEAIDRTDVLIIAADIEVTGLKRFNDKPQVKVPIRKTANEPTTVIEQARAVAGQSRVRAYDREAPQLKDDHGKKTGSQAGDADAYPTSERTWAATGTGAPKPSLRDDKAFGY